MYVIILWRKARLGKWEGKATQTRKLGSGRWSQPRKKLVEEDRSSNLGKPEVMWCSVVFCT